MFERLYNRIDSWTLKTCMSLVLAVTVLAAGCATGMEDGMPGDGDDNGAATDLSVNESLNMLGVNTAESPRLDEQGNPLPDNFSPLGPTLTISTRELFIAGPKLVVKNGELLQNRAVFAELSNDEVPPSTEFAVTDAIEPDTVWESDNGSDHPELENRNPGAQSTRAIAAGDVDRDGLDEIIIVFQDPAAPQNVYLEILEDDGDAANARSTARTLFANVADLKDLSVAAGDFDGNGSSEVAVGITTPTTAELRFLKRSADGNFSVQGANTKTFEQKSDGSIMSLELATGNLDRDNPVELAAVFNEFIAGSPNKGTARYFVYDDETTGFAVLAGNQQITDARDEPAVVADVDFGELDGDGKDEIVFAGLLEFSDDSNRPVGHVFLALDDAVAADGPLQTISMGSESYRYIPPDPANVVFMRAFKVHVNTIDLDGDGIDEVHANRFIYHVGANWVKVEGCDLLEELLTPGFLQNEEANVGSISDATSVMLAADVTGNGREELLSFMQWRDSISVLGLDLDNQWTKYDDLTIPTQDYNHSSKVFPIIVSCNVDKDGLVLKYENEYKFALTEPIIIAALAAAPCRTGVGQNIDACSTTYGRSESSSTGTDNEVSFRAGIYFAFEAKDPFLNIGAEGRVDVSVEASFSTSQSYELTQTIEFTTGPLEDTVVFSAIPVDMYTYTVASHRDPDLVGTSFTVHVPRTPIITQAEREFYNNSVPDGAFQVGENVFAHTPGDVNSYPTEAEADAILRANRFSAQTLPAVGDEIGLIADVVDQAFGGDELPFTEFSGGIKADMDTVPLGTGSRTTTLEFSKNTEYRAGAGISFNAELGFSARGVTAGVTIGSSFNSGISWGTGSSTIYSGRIGAIPDPGFGGANLYNYGLFTYVFNAGDPMQPQFEVINYWVE